MMRARLAAVAAVAVCALALGACGGDDDETTSSSTTTTTSTTTEGATGAAGATGAEGTGGVPTAKDVTKCAAGIDGAKASDEDEDVSVDVPALELDAGVPPTGGAPATGETRIEFQASFVNLVFFDDAAAAEDAVKTAAEAEETKASEGRLGSAGTVLYYVTFDDLAPDQLDAINGCLTEAGGKPIPSA